MSLFKHQIILLLFALVNFNSCKSEDPNFRYVKLEDFKYSQATIKEGDKIQLLSFSGGKACSPEESYFYQFIGINLSTNDTVRILAPCQNFDVAAKPTEGTFTPWDKSSEMINKVLKDHGEKELVAEKKFVVFNKNQKEIEEGNYKTAIGTLGFD